MPKPLSIDLRGRIVEGYELATTTFREIAERFSVGEATVNRLVNRFRKSGSIAPKPHAGGPAPMLGEVDLARIAALVSEKPDRTIAELVSEMKRRHSRAMGTATMSRALARMKLTRKKRVSQRRSATASAS
jgi:transposase